MTSLIKFFIPLMLFGFMVTFSGCEVTRQAKKATNLSSCDFRILTVEDVNLGGVKLQNIKSVNDLNFSDIAIIVGGLASPVFPLTLQLILEGRNPNSKEAGLNRLDWILFIDDNQVTSGILDKPFTIPANSRAIIPVQIGLDLKQILSGKSAESVLNFCLNLSGSGNAPSRLKIKLKPTIMVGSSALRYPGYITVNTTYSLQ